MQIFIYQGFNKTFKNNSSSVILEKLALAQGWGSLSVSNTGKPLSEKGYLSVAHSSDYLIIAHSRHAIGIDLEQIRPLKTELIKKFDLDPNNPILSWCQKEALIKLHDDKSFLFKKITTEYWQTIDVDQAYCCVVVSTLPISTYEIMPLKII